MRVYKATNADMECTMGRGIFRYTLGEPAVAEASKCVGTGLHACEYVLDCTAYYRLGGGNRFFVAEAGGDIVEDGTDTKIACTELTLLQELDNRMVAKAAIRYMIKHPKRGNWEKTGHMLHVAADAAVAVEKDGIAIARGEDPRVKGCAGAHLGLVRESGGKITGAYLLTVSGPVMPDTWYTIETAREAAGKGCGHET